MSKVKAIAGILLIFVSGAIVGTLVTRMIYENRIDALAGGDIRTRDAAILKRLSRQLDLDEEQKKKVMAVVREIRQDMERAAQPVRPQVKAALVNGSEKIKGMLRPDQLEKYEKILARKKLRQLEWDKTRRDRKKLP